jgi:hypothetical protein
LKANDSAPAVVQTEVVVAAVEESEMDREGFRVEEYLERTMEKDGLESILTIEGSLVNGGLLLCFLWAPGFGCCATLDCELYHIAVKRDEGIPAIS